MATGSGRGVRLSAAQVANLIMSMKDDDSDHSFDSGSDDYVPEHEETDSDESECGLVVQVGLQYSSVAIKQRKA